ncbi:hypothetical protein BH24ACI2_BH24ACI2_07840 [soil metagenome]|jgi:hypothetical protein|nr:hypothetical protein [Acidobacteriota bacterium]
MNNEFDFEPERLEFEDFNGDLEDFDEFDEMELSEIKVRTAILSKNNMVALLCVKTATEGGAICRVDPREVNPSVQIYDDPAKAIEWFTKSLRTSKQNGWQVAYDGLPLHG